ncbi:MAG: cytochrome c family protein [Hyphomicrobiales bacterium]
MYKEAITALLVLFTAPAPAMAEGDIKKGKKVFKKCKACHSLTEGKNKVGPSMFDLIGSNSGAVEGYKYSDAMLAANLTWDEATLKEFLRKPKELVPKTKMAFGGLKKEKQIDDLFAYLQSVAEK